MPIYVSLMNFIISYQEKFFKQIHLYTVLKQGINVIFIDQPIFFQKNRFYDGIKIFNSLPPSVTVLKNDKAKFKTALRKFLHAHSFNSRWILCYKDDL